VDIFASRHIAFHFFEGNALGGRFETIDTLVGSRDSDTASSITPNSLKFPYTRFVKDFRLSIPKYSA